MRVLIRYQWSLRLVRLNTSFFLSSLSFSVLYILDPCVTCLSFHFCFYILSVLERLFSKFFSAVYSFLFPSHYLLSPSLLVDRFHFVIIRTGPSIFLAPSLLSSISSVLILLNLYCQDSDHLLSCPSERHSYSGRGPFFQDRLYQFAM